MIKKPFTVIAFMTAVSLTACASSHNSSTAMKVGMANPASVYCEKLGGKSIIKKDKEGDVGYCQLPNGQIIEEWKLYHQHHAEQRTPSK